MAACIYESPLSTLDQQTADLILQLQLEDTEVYFSSAKGKGREGEVSDETLAFEMQRQEIETMSLFCTDNRMARSMGSAVVSDGQLLLDSWFLEDTAARDREIAHQLNRGIETPSRSIPRALQGCWTTRSWRSCEFYMSLASTTALQMMTTGSFNPWLVIGQSHLRGQRADPANCHLRVAVARLAVRLSSS